MTAGSNSLTIVKKPNARRKKHGKRIEKKNRFYWSFCWASSEPGFYFVVKCYAPLESLRKLLLLVRWGIPQFIIIFIQLGVGNVAKIGMGFPAATLSQRESVLLRDCDDVKTHRAVRHVVVDVVTIASPPNLWCL